MQAAEPDQAPVEPLDIAAELDAQVRRIKAVEQKQKFCAFQTIAKIVSGSALDPEARVEAAVEYQKLKANALELVVRMRQGATTKRTRATMLPNGGVQLEMFEGLDELSDDDLDRGIAESAGEAGFVLSRQGKGETEAGK